MPAPPTAISSDPGSTAAEATGGRRGRGRGDRRRSQPGRDVLAGAEPGPEGHSRLGPRLRRRRRASGRPRVGREGADPLADHPGGREDRAVRLRGPRAVLRRPDRADAADRQRGAVLGRRGDRHVDHGHRARGGGDLRPGLGRADRRVDPALLRHRRTTSRSPRSAPRSPTPARTFPRCAHVPSSTRPRASGSSTARRRGRRTAASPTSTW